MPSFTTQVPNLQGIGPLVEVRLAVGSVIEEVLRKDDQLVPTPILVNAMIDTGATGTVVREDIPAQLGLDPTGVTSINTPSSTDVECYEYLVRLLFPNRVLVETTVIGAPLKGQHIQSLIGRDVLRHGVFIYIGYTNTFTLSF